MASPALVTDVLEVGAPREEACGATGGGVRFGAEELGSPTEEQIAFCIVAMRDVADTLGLRENQAASV
jgi:hypothetical protein